MASVVFRKLPVSAAAILAGMIFWSCAATHGPASPGPGFTLEELLSRMPARDTLETRWLSASLLQLGPDAILELCDRLDSAGTAGSAQAEYALQALAVAVSRGGAEEGRTLYVSALAKALERPRPPGTVTFILARLQMAGKEESIPVAARYLADLRLCEPAAQALAAMKGEKALLAALAGSTGDCRRTIVKNLGELRSAAAVDALLKDASSEDRGLRRAALAALANIGDSRAGALLAASVARSVPAERNEYTSFWLLYARRQIEGGNPAAAVEVAKELLGGGSGDGNDPARPAALRLLVRAEGDGAADELAGAMSDTSRQYRRAALDLAEKIGGEKATARWVGVLQSAAPPVRAEILGMLGRRGDASAGPAILERLGDADSTVRHAAAGAAARLPGSGSVKPLLALLERSNEASDIGAVKEALELLPPESVIAPALESLPRVRPEARVMLLDVLGKYGTAVPAERIIEIARNGPMATRTAAVRALGSVGDESAWRFLIEMYQNTRDDAMRPALQRSLVSLSSRGGEKRAEELCDVYAGASREERLSLLPVIGRVGGRRALALVGSEIRTGDPDIRDAAIRALAEWPSISAYDTLLSVARSNEKLNHRVLALRGCVRVVENAPITPIEAVRYHERTLKASERVEEKRLVIGALANLRIPYALKVVAPYVRDDSVGLDAALAAGRISGGAPAPEGEIGPASVARAFIDAELPARFLQQAHRKLDAAPGMNDPPAGYRALFNGKNLEGWKGLVENPVARSKMTPAQLAAAQAKADSIMRAHWAAADGTLVFDGKGESLCTAEDFQDFELLVDWKIDPLGDSGIYLRGSPQVQIWDPAQWPEGSGGLYNNQKNPARPLRCADRPIGEWNTFRIRMIGERVTVYLNDVLVVDSVVLENYWDRSMPIFPSGQIELQSHSSPLAFRNVFLREIPRRLPLFSGKLFNGSDLSGWTVVGGTEKSWGAKDGILFTTGEGGGWLSTERVYDNFELELDFRLPTGGNSGVFLRSPRQGDPAYTGMEIQVLDDAAPEYAKLHAWQYCGSLYGVVAAAKGASGKANEWQHYRIVALGPRVTVTLNGKVVVDADLIQHMDKESTHPGLKRRSGFVGLQSHGDKVEFRNITLKELEWRE